ncbi:hypothetical protein HK102_013989 [Quaeritorhiza haematococci]|nr:hypothetical protein HK102_013989 [Quaeritorhiza haematococci]
MDLDAIRGSVFGNFKKEKLTDLDVLTLLYAAVGVPYEDVAFSAVPVFAYRHGWLEHYSRVICGCEEDEDKAYETEYPDEAMYESEREQRRNARRR